VQTILALKSQLKKHKPSCSAAKYCNSPQTKRSI
jgi:hypothetical protein